MITDEFIQNESGITKDERQWLAWVDGVEKCLGHSIDGNQTANGYSLGAASDAFDSGMSYTDYADQVRGSLNYHRH